MSRFRSPAARVRTSVAGVVAAAVATGGMATVPAAAAAPAAAPGATTAAATSAAPAPAAAALAPPTYDVLVFSKTTGFRHDSIGAGIRCDRAPRRAVRLLRHGHRGRGAFTAANLAQYEAVVWMSTTGDVLNADAADRLRELHQGRRRLCRRPRRLRHRVHWPWYGQLVGAYFRATPPAPPPRPSTSRTRPRRPRARCRTGGSAPTSGTTSRARPTPWSTAAGPTTARAPTATSTSSPRSTSRRYDEQDGAPGDDDHPIAWYQEFDGGRSFYTGGGHTDASFSEPLFRLHLLGGIQYAAGRPPDACTAAGAARTPPSSRSRSPRAPTRSASRWRIVGPARPSVLHTARDGRICPHRPRAATPRCSATLPSTPTTRRACRASRRPGLRDEPLHLPLLRPAARHPGRRRPRERHRRADFAAWQGYNRLSRFKLNDDGTLDPASEQEILRRPGRPRHLLPRRRRHRLRRRRQPLPVHRRRHQPVRLRRLHADRRAHQPQPGLRRPAQRRQHQRPARQGPADQARHDRRRRTRSRSGNLFAPGTAKTRPEIYAMGFRNPFRMSVDKAHRLRLPRRLRPRRRRRRPQPRPRRAGRVQPDHRGRQLRLAVLHRRQHRSRDLQRLGLRDRHVRPEVRLRGAGNNSSAQHRPDRPAAGPGRLDPVRRRQRPRRPARVRRRLRVARWAARSTATTPTSTRT